MQDFAVPGPGQGCIPHEFGGICVRFGISSLSSVFHCLVLSVVQGKGAELLIGTVGSFHPKVVFRISNMEHLACLHGQC